MQINVWHIITPSSLWWLTEPLTELKRLYLVSPFRVETEKSPTRVNDLLSGFSWVSKSSACACAHTHTYTHTQAATQWCWSNWEEREPAVVEEFPVQSGLIFPLLLLSPWSALIPVQFTKGVWATPKCMRNSWAYESLNYFSIKCHKPQSLTIHIALLKR